MSVSDRSVTPLLLASALSLAIAGAAPAIDLPSGFVDEIAAGGLDNPVAMAFASDGRIFVAERRGLVRVIDPAGNLLPAPFIDLQDETGNAWDRGMLGIALDPAFETNHRVYLLYTVDPVFGRPDEPGETGTFSRLVRYSGTPASDGNVADTGSRAVLIGTTPDTGIPACYASHVIGALRFGHDGSLFISSGDSASFGWADAGGTTPSCFEEGLFGPDEDLGAYRAQSLTSLDGKILRVDPETGEGLPDNPFFDGNGSSNTSRIWCSGLRNPFRMAVRPGSPPPGTLYIGDVGWFTMEEINVSKGGENFGWPCYEGLNAAPQYPDQEVPAWSCDTIGTEINPGPLRQPLMQWHHGVGTFSVPSGVVGFCAVAGVFYEGLRYPPVYHDRFFYADHVFNWIRTVKVNAADQATGYGAFAENADHPVDFASHPTTGDIHYVTLAGTIHRIRFAAPDLNSDGKVDGSDLGLLLADWFKQSSPADFNGDNKVNGADLGIMLASWS